MNCCSTSTHYRLEPRPTNQQAAQVQNDAQQAYRTLTDATGNADLVIANGRPDTLARVETDTLELETWQTQFAGRRIDGDTPEAALAWCIETFDDMHAALGLADADNA